MLNLARLFCSVSAIIAVANVADAGCKCKGGGGGVPPAPAAWSGGYGQGVTPLYDGSAYGGSAYGVAPGMAAGAYTPGLAGAYAPVTQQYGGQVATNGPNWAPGGPHWAPGGYEPRTGSPAYYHDPTGGQYVVTGEPYYDHFGPGFHRSSIHGHYRFPYYNYRAPWYYPGRAVYNRNTNFAW